MSNLRIKKASVWVALFLVMALLVGCGGGQPAPQPKADAPKAEAKKPIKIGVVFDISGAGSSLGVPERDSVKMIQEKLNAEGGVNGNPVELVIMDNKSDPTETVTVVKQLIDQGVVALVGTSQSSTSLAVTKVANDAQIPMVSAAASIKIVEDPKEKNKWIFKTAQNDSVVAGKIIDYLKSKNLKKIAFLSVNNAFGDSGVVEFGKVAKAAGIDIAVAEKFGADDKDMTPQLTKVKNGKVDATIVWAIPPAASMITKGHRDLGVPGPIIHSHGIGNKTFIDLAGKASEGVVFPIGKLLVAEDLPDTDVQKKVLMDYVKGYEAKYGPRSTFGGHGWDAAMIVLEAIKKVGPDKAKIRDELEKMSFVGISGPFKFTADDHSGLNKDALVMVEIKEGKWRLAK